MDWDFACTLRRLTLGLLLAGFGSIALAQGQGYWGGAAGLAAAVGLAILVVLAVVVLGLGVLTYRWGGARALMVFVALVVGILVAGKLDHYLTTERRLIAEASDDARLCTASAGERITARAAPDALVQVRVDPVIRRSSTHNLPRFVQAQEVPIGQSVSLVDQLPPLDPSSTDVLVDIGPSESGSDPKRWVQGYRVTVTRRSDGVLLAERVDFDAAGRLCLIDQSGTERFLRDVLQRPAVFMPAETTGVVRVPTQYLLATVSGPESGRFEQAWFASEDYKRNSFHREWTDDLRGCVYRPQDLYEPARGLCAQGSPDENKFEMSSLRIVQPLEDGGWLGVSFAGGASDGLSALLLERRLADGVLSGRWVVNMPLLLGASRYKYARIAHLQTFASSASVDVYWEWHESYPVSAGDNYFQKHARVTFPMVLSAKTSDTRR